MTFQTSGLKIVIHHRPEVIVLFITDLKQVLLLVQGTGVGSEGGRLKA